MARVPIELCRRLADAAGLKRAVETGTYHGASARLLAETFPSVISIELSPELHAKAQQSLGAYENLELVQGDSAAALREIDHDTPTLYWLDAHYSGGITATGETTECPVLEEIAAISPGHPDDCILIDDARLFATSYADWPTLTELFEAIQEQRPDHHITVLHDLVVAIPQTARSAFDRWGSETAAVAEQAAALVRHPPAESPSLARRVGRRLRLARFA